MRLALAAALAAFAIAATACTPREATERCDVTVSRDIEFTGGAEADSVTVRALGMSCDKAILLYAVHDAEGRPIWAWATPLPRAFGDVFEAEDEEAMNTFLLRWAQPHIATTQSAPEWEALAPGQTTLDQLTYSDIRARDLPMLCHFSGTARQACVFWEPAAGGAGHFIDRDVEEPT